MKTNLEAQDCNKLIHFHDENLLHDIRDSQGICVGINGCNPGSIGALG